MTPGFLADVLSRTHNHAYRLAVKTSKDWQIPPTQVLEGRPKEWGRVDTKLSMAMVILDQETCKDCGTVSWLGHSTDNRIVFKHEETHCYGCAELERKRAEESKNKKTSDYGVKPYVNVEGDMGMELPSRTAEYERRARRAERAAQRKANAEAERNL